MTTDTDAPKIHRYNAPAHAVGVKLTSQRRTGAVVYLDAHLAYSDHASEAAAFDSVADAERAIAIVRAGYERVPSGFRWTPEIMPLADLRAQARARWQEKRDGRTAAARDAADRAREDRIAMADMQQLDNMGGRPIGED